MVFVMPFLFQWKNLGIFAVNKNNENLTSFLHLVISCMSARSAPQILPQKEECTFLVMVLCNSSAYGKKIQKIRFESNDHLPRNKPMRLHLLTIIIRYVFSQGGKFYP